MADQYLFQLPAWPAVPVIGEHRLYPVRRIFCVGRNYSDHAKEMGMTVNRDAPFYFTKSALALVPNGSTISYPMGTANYQYEIELVVALGADLANAAALEAEAAIYGFAVGLDMTRRDLQIAARDRSLPWDLGKDFEESAVVGPIARKAGFAGYDRRIWLSADDDLRQDSNVAELVWNVADLLSHLSRYYHLGAGDMIFTGTPAGVGPIGPGTRLRGGIDGLADVELTIAAPPSHP